MNTNATKGSFTIEYNERTQFRIVSPLGKKGGWTWCRGLAKLEENGKIFVAGSDFGLLPEADTVYEITGKKTTVKDR